MSRGNILHGPFLWVFFLPFKRFCSGVSCGVVGVWQCGAFLLGASASCSGSRSGSGGRVSCTKHLFKVNPQASQLETHALSPGSLIGSGSMSLPRRSQPRHLACAADLTSQATPRISSVPSAGYSKGLAHAPPGGGPVSCRLDRRTATLLTPTRKPGCGTDRVSNQTHRGPGLGCSGA